MTTSADAHQTNILAILAREMPGLTVDITALGSNTYEVSATAESARRWFRQALAGFDVDDRPDGSVVATADSTDYLPRFEKLWSGSPDDSDARGWLRCGGF